VFSINLPKTVNNSKTWNHKIVYIKNNFNKPWFHLLVIVLFDKRKLLKKSKWLEQIVYNYVISDAEVYWNDSMEHSVHTQMIQ
jgi:hypothetical protein